MFGLKSLIIGSGLVLIGGGVVFLSHKADREFWDDSNEASFSERWKGSSHQERLILLGQELENMCKLNSEDCGPRRGGNHIVSLSDESKYDGLQKIKKIVCKESGNNGSFDVKVEGYSSVKITCKGTSSTVEFKY